MAAPGSARFKRSAATTSRSFTWTGHSELETNLPRKRGESWWTVLANLRLLETHFLGSFWEFWKVPVPVVKNICKLLVKGENIRKVGSN